MKNFMRDNYLWWAVKIMAAVYQASATYRVFYNKLEDTGRESWERGLDSVLAILLIDLFFLAVLYFLESDDISVFNKFPLVLIGIGLAVAIIAIGITDEGTMAWGPRIGILGLIFTDVFKWSSEVGKMWWQRHTYRTSREFQEQCIRDSEVIARRKAKEKATKKAYEVLADEFLQTIIERERRNLRTIEDKIDMVVVSPKQTDLPLVNIDPVELSEGVWDMGNGTFAWNVDDGDLVTEGAFGKAYSTQQGAQRARSRVVNAQSRSKNGKRN